jgi:molybdate transport system ATP-binding protein
MAGAPRRAAEGRLTVEGLAVDITRRQGEFMLEARFATHRRVVALFGPSGAGKSTVVHAVAGLVRPDTGSIRIGGSVLFDAAAGIDVPAHRRRIGYVFQDARLFPHLSVRSNLFYGHRLTPAAERTADPDAVIAMLGIGGLLDRRPDTLSGGERQRVAIGRALLASPRILLMDEPLASLDAARKAEILPWLERLRDESAVPILYVSHSLEEVNRLAEEVVAMDAGRVTGITATPL